jgi:hypothetical protein
MTSGTCGYLVGERGFLEESDMRRAMLLTLTLCLAAPNADAVPSPPKEKPTETVVTTFRVKEGREAEFWDALSKAWPLYRRLGMVLERPHLIVKGTDKDQKTYFMEVLTWKDSDAPDNAPPEVRKLWDRLEELCEPRLGHRGIEFPEVDVVVDGCVHPKSSR